MALIDRRGFLAATAASAALLKSRAGFAMAPKRVIVIGAGIIGASIAYHLARRGVAVTVLEKEAPTAGATRNSFAWLTSYLKWPAPYGRLTMAGIDSWRRLQLDVGPEMQIQWGGSIYWVLTEDGAKALKAQAEQRERLGHPMRMIEADMIDKLLPRATPGPVAAAAFTPVEGGIDPVTTTQLLLARAQQLGAKVIHPCELLLLELGDGRIEAIQTSKGRMVADHYVLAAGVDTMPLAKKAGFAVPLVDAPGVLAHSKPLPPILDRIVILPDFRAAGIKQNADGRIVTGGHFAGSTLTPDRETGEKMLARAARFIPQLQRAELDYMTLGHGVRASDDMPVIGSAPGRANLYVTAMDSGVTLAAIVGQLASIELCDGVEVEMLAPFRPGRFA